jgi:hypothetical protein
MDAIKKVYDGDVQMIDASSACVYPQGATA